MVTKNAALRLRADPVARAADPLQRDRDRTRRAELHDQIDRADVDAELERRRRHHRAQLAGCRAAARRRSAVSRDRLPWCGMTTPSPRRSLSANATRSLMRRVLTKISVVGVADICCGDAVVDLAPHLLAGDRTQLVARAPRRPASISRRWPTSTIVARSLRNRATSSIGRTVAERPMRCGFVPPSRATRSSSRSSDSARCAPRLSRGHGVDLVDDDGPHAGEAARATVRRSSRM